MDIITIKALKISTIIGTLAHERKIPQTLKISIDFKIDASIPAQNDDLQATVDYSALCGFVQEFGQNSNYQLLETFAENLSKACLDHFPIHWVKLSVQKPSAIPEADYIALTLERSA